MVTVFSQLLPGSSSSRGTDGAVKVLESKQTKRQGMETSLGNRRSAFASARVELCAKLKGCVGQLSDTLNLGGSEEELWS